IDVVDTSTPPGHYLRTIPLGTVPNGVEFVPEFHRLYVADLESNVSVIDTDPASPRRFAVVAKIATDGRGPADLMDYDAARKRLYVTNPDDGFISTIDVERNVVVSQVQNLGALQQPRHDPANGMLYVLNTDNNSIIKIGRAHV